MAAVAAAPYSGAISVVAPELVAGSPTAAGIDLECLRPSLLDDL